MFVRVGGGYIHIEDFINKYTNGEVEKIDRKDVVNKFRNKISIQ